MAKQWLKSGFRAQRGLLKRRLPNRYLGTRTAMYITCSCKRLGCIATIIGVTRTENRKSRYENSVSVWFENGL